MFLVPRQRNTCDFQRLRITIRGRSLLPRSFMGRQNTWRANYVKTTRGRWILNGGRWTALFWTGAQENSRWRPGVLVRSSTKRSPVSRNKFIANFSLSLSFSCFEARQTAPVSQIVALARKTVRGNFERSNRIHYSSIPACNYDKQFITTFTNLRFNDNYRNSRSNRIAVKASETDGYRNGGWCGEG